MAPEGSVVVTCSAEGPMPLALKLFDSGLLDSHEALLQWSTRFEGRGSRSCDALRLCPRLSGSNPEQAVWGLRATRADLKFYTAKPLKSCFDH